MRFMAWILEQFYAKATEYSDATMRETRVGVEARCTFPNATKIWGGKRGAALGRAPNNRLQPTASSVRSCVAPAVRRESGVEECGNTFGYTGAR